MNKAWERALFGHTVKTPCSNAYLTGVSGERITKYLQTIESAQRRAAIRIVTTLGPCEFGALLLWPQLTPDHSLFSHSAFFASLTGPPGVKHDSFTAKPPDLPSRLYVYPLGFGLCSNLTHRLALYPVSVRRLLDFATPLPPLPASPPAACGSLRLAVKTRDRTFTD